MRSRRPFRRAVAMRAGLWLLGATLLLARFSASTSLAGEAEDTAARKAKEAAAKLEAKSYWDALALYEEALKTLGTDRGLLADAATCAWHTHDYPRAKELAGRAMTGADEAFRVTPRAKALAALLPRIDLAIKQKARPRDEFIKEYTTSVLQGLTQHTALLKSKYLEMSEDLNFLHVKPEYDVDDFWASLSPAHEGKNVRGYTSEDFLDRAGAEARVKWITDLVHGQKAAWEKAFVHRTKKDAYPLLELENDSTKEDDRGSHKFHAVYFCWNPGTISSAIATAVVALELHEPRPPDPTDPKDPPKWNVHLQFYSVSFR